jgi:tetratricopeptide (TPR) repeat protein
VRDTPRTLKTLHNLAFVSLRDGQAEQSLALAQEVLARRTAALGPDNYATATAEMQVGAALAALGKDDEARARLEHAVKVVEAARGVVHVDLAEPLEALARLDLKAGRKARALERFERAVTCRRALNGYPQRLARALLGVAELTVDAERAVTMASEAVTLFEKAGPRFSAERAEAQRVVEQLRGKAGR